MKSQKKGEDRNCLRCRTLFYAHKYKIDKGQGNYCSQACWGESRKGHTPWNKNTKGVMKPNSGSFRKGIIPKNSVTFKKGHIPYSKGRRLPERSGENHPFWKGGKYINDSGYILQLRKDHPGRQKKPYLREHRLVLEKHLGRILTKDEIVHHLNGNKTDNRVENLMIVTRSQHIKMHRQELYAARWNK